MRKLHFKGINIVSPFLIMLLTLDKANVITLFPFVFYRTKYSKERQITRTHEIIHIRQQMECGLAGTLCSCLLWFAFHTWLISLPAIFLFYILYLGFYIWKLIIFKDRKKAYREIPFEKEAYLNDNFQYYPQMRKIFAWIKYI